MEGEPDWSALMRQAVAEAKAQARRRRRRRRRRVGGGDHGQPVDPTLPPNPGNPNVLLWPNGDTVEWPDGQPVEF